MPALEHIYRYRKLETKRSSDTVPPLKPDERAYRAITAALQPRMSDPGAPLPPDVNHGTGLVAVAWVEASLGLVVLLARMYTRVKIVKKMGLDDWTMILATVSVRYPAGTFVSRLLIVPIRLNQILAFLTSVVVTMQVHYGVGRHAAHIPPPQLVKAVHWIWLSTPMSTQAACWGKISISLLILRMFTRNRAYTIFLWTLIFLLFIINIVLAIITFVQCTPASWLWDQLNPTIAGYRGTCWNPSIVKNYGYFQGGMAGTALSHLIHPHGHLDDQSQSLLPPESANKFLTLKSILRLLRSFARSISDLDHQRPEDTVEAKDRPLCRHVLGDHSHSSRHN